MTTTTTTQPAAWVCACGFTQYQCNDKQGDGGCMLGSSDDDEPEDDGLTLAERLGLTRRSGITAPRRAWTDYCGQMHPETRTRTMTLHYLKATFPDGRVECTGSTRPFAVCWLDTYGRRHWSMTTVRAPLGAPVAPAVAITGTEYRALKADQLVDRQAAE